MPRIEILAALSLLVAITSLILVHNILGYMLGYDGAKSVGMDEKSSRTITFELGIQNLGLASGISIEMGHISTMVLAPTVFDPIVNMLGSSLAVYW
ncbi:MAG: BASS family bile acid:Na+ symporter [Paraglaciecola sp.]|jgi:BASS family bile acid:Na+ symporter